ncbi:MAG: TetR/AcrR family transcriptional regulator [Candidatus Korobacteraceae bacterium]
MPDKARVESLSPLSSHDRILRAAKHLFARNGYENTSTVAISREAGTSESQMMKHFGSKQGLLTAIFDRGWAAIAERVQMAQKNPAVPERLLGVLEAIVIELENDSDLKEIMALESWRVRKDNRDVLLSQGFQRFADVVDGILAEMRDRGQIRPDVNLQAVRAAYMGITEGLLRDQVVAQRSEFVANYNFEDVRRVLEILVPAFRDERPQSLKAVNQ